LNALIEPFGSIYLLPIYSVFLVVFVEKHLKLADKFHPLTFARLIAQRLAYKVHNRNPGTSLQQMTAGFLAPIVLLSPLILLLGVLIFLSEFPIFFDSLLLLIALRFEPIVKTVQKVELSLRQNKKTLAKQQLQTIVLRKTEQLSPFGIAKAAIETLILRFALQYCSVIMLYLLGGGMLALAYRILFEFSHCWNSKQHDFIYFGRPLRWLLVLVQWIPARISALCFIIGQNIYKGIGALGNKTSLTCSRNFLLNLTGASLGFELGGPVFYNSSKSRFAKCGGQRSVALDDIRRTVQALRKAKWVFLTFCFVTSLLLNIGK
jgi:adenosylcobinamide-phosphate synthase